MAKKNLHIKRGSATQTSTSTSSSTSTSTMAPISTIVPTPSSESSSLKTRYDSFSPLPSDLLSQEYESPSFNDSLFGIRSQSFDQDLGFITSRAFSLHSQPPQQQNIQQQQQQNIQLQQQNIQQQQQQIHQQHSIQQHQHNIHQQHIHLQHQQQLKMMNDLDNSDPYHYLSKSSPVPIDRFENTLEHDLMRMGSLSISSSSLDLRSPSPITSRLPNPADQNPPCNTLYVGNLPPNTSEEELRQVFSNCKGYRRMCFRTKPQGPMCFVEFEDIVYASQALNELQGHNLTNSVKGGIRLSYSKNPLFIKPNKENGLMSFKQMGNALMNRDFMFDPQL